MLEQEHVMAFPEDMFSNVETNMIAGDFMDENRVDSKLGERKGA